MCTNIPSTTDFSIFGIGVILKYLLSLCISPRLEVVVIVPLKASSIFFKVHSSTQQYHHSANVMMVLLLMHIRIYDILLLAY